jgi:hypothetical protein
MKKKNVSNKNLQNIQAECGTIRVCMWVVELNGMKMPSPLELYLTGYFRRERM